MASDSFFEIASPTDMLGKAKRDFERMKADLNTDTIFNFFVTIYHVGDYVKAQGVSIKSLYSNKDFKLCQSICNKGKHLVIDKKGNTQDITARQVFIPRSFGSPIPWGAPVPFGAVGISFIEIDGQPVNVIALGQRLIEMWENFFVTHGIA